MMSEMDVNAIAGTLKLYFRELPEPLFTDEFYPNFAEGIGEHGRFPLSTRSVFQSKLGGWQGDCVPGWYQKASAHPYRASHCTHPSKWPQRVKQPLPLWTHWGLGS